MEQFRPVHVVQEDTDLATRLRARDVGALRTLVARHGAAAFAVANVASGDAPRAADLAAGVFVEAWRGADEFEPGRDFAPWLVEITRRLIDSSGEPTRGDELAWASRTVVDTLDGREVLRLRTVEHLDPAAIVDRTGLDDAAVAAHLERADRRLATGLAHLADVGEVDVAALLANPSFWELPPADLDERVVASVFASVERASDGNTANHDLVATVAPRRPVRRPDAETVEPLTTWRRSSIRPALFGAAAAVLALFGGVVVLSALSDAPASDSFTTTLTPTGEILDVGGEVEIIESDAGLDVVLDAPSLPRLLDRSFYQAWIGTDDGRLIPVGTFRRGGRITMTAGIERSRAVSFEITIEDPVAGDDIGQASSDVVVLRASIG